MEMYKPYALKERRTGNILNTAYSPEGLYWTTDNAGRLVYFKNARFQKVYDKVTRELTHLKIVGDTRPNNEVFIDQISKTAERTLVRQKLPVRA